MANSALSELRFKQTHKHTKHGVVKKDKMKTVMEPELGQNREVSFLTSKRSFSTEKTTPRQNSGFTKTVLKPEMPFIFGVMGNEEWVVKKLRPRALLYSSLRSKISGRANNEIQTSLLFPF